jgi:hypothetical protein
VAGEVPASDHGLLGRVGRVTSHALKVTYEFRAATPAPAAEPVRTCTRTCLTDSKYGSRHIWNCLAATYSYDCLGRTLSVSLPGGSGTTTYAYQGNTTTVTEPAGKWKKFTPDALGNLIQVTEPNPRAAPTMKPSRPTTSSMSRLSSPGPAPGLRTEIRDDTMKGRWQFRT